MNAIETYALSKTYANGVVGIEGMELRVPSGTIFGLLGPNGSGKTTTVRVLNGTLTASSGSATVLGRDCASEENRRETATLAEQAELYRHLSARENLRFFGELHGVERSRVDDRIDELLSRMGLAGKAELKLGSFSTGMKQRVQLARTLLHRPRLLFLDEPTAGLDPESAVNAVELIETLAHAEGTTILLCTHNLALAERACSGFAFLADGTVVAAGEKEELFRRVTGRQQVEITSQLGTERFEFDRNGEINSLIQSVIRRGGMVEEVRMVRPTLEEVYFRYVGSRMRTGET